MNRNALSPVAGASIPVQPVPFTPYPPAPTRYSNQIQQMPNMLGIPAPYNPERSSYAAEMSRWEAGRPGDDRIADLVELGMNFLPVPIGTVYKTGKLSGNIPRVNPILINKKQWYHGTGTPNLQAEHLNPTMTKIDNLFSQGIYVTDNPEIAAGYANARGRSTGTPTIYQARANVGKVLDLEKPITPKVSKAILDAANRIDNIAYGSDEVSWALQQVLKKPGATVEEAWRALNKATSDVSHGEGISISEFFEPFEILSEDLRKIGYDALTYTGGKRTGNAPHQVLIFLDPNDTMRLGKLPNIRDWRVKE